MIDNDLVGRLIAKIGRPGFDAAFFDLARRTLDISSCSAFSFEDEKQPMPVILEGLGVEQRARAKSLGSTYASDGFRHDPQVRHLFGVTDLEVRIVSPADIGDIGFRDHYYGEPRIGSEIALLAKLNAKRYNIGLYRTAGKPRFDQASLSHAQELARVILPALDRHIELLMAQVDQEQDESCQPAKPTRQTMEHLAAVLVAEGHGLSPREAQVCAAIVMGYRTLAISLNLGISENTICTHRKRAYAKLGISSQNELFSRYFRTVNRLGGGRSGSPATQDDVAALAW